MWAITAFFNPTDSPALLENLQQFAPRVRRQGARLLIVELAFEDAPFVVDEALADRVVRLRSPDILWQKERLLNIGVAALPRDAEHVAWLDGDVIFENDAWVAETTAALADAAIVQPFASAAWLRPGERSAPPCLPPGIGEGREMGGFAATLAALDGEARRRALLDYTTHGHTGFAWAARRALLETHGLYDRAIVGGGDLINAHVFAGDADYLRGRGYCARMLTPAERAAVRAWGSDVARATGGRLGWVPGRVLHLFHGWLSRRAYDARTHILRDGAFDPLVDIAHDEGSAWRWAGATPELRARVREYFGARLAAPQPEAAAGFAASAGAW